MSVFAVLRCTVAKRGPCQLYRRRQLTNSANDASVLFSQLGSDIRLSKMLKKSNTVVYISEEKIKLIYVLYLYSAKFFKLFSMCKKTFVDFFFKYVKLFNKDQINKSYLESFRKVV